MRTLTAILFLVVALESVAQVPSVEERSALYTQFLSTQRRLTGGTVQSHWLPDGSSFVWRSGEEWTYTNPEQGTPRAATAEEITAAGATASQPETDRVYAPDSTTYVRIEEFNVVVGDENGERTFLISEPIEGIQRFFGNETWSANGEYFHIGLHDTRNTHHVPIVDFSVDEIVGTHPVPQADGPIARTTFYLFNATSGERVKVAHDEDDEYYVYPLGWRSASEEFLFLRLTRDAKTVHLMAADVSTGSQRIVLSESQTTSIGGLEFMFGGWMNIFYPLEGEESFYWLSERDGWRHVYEYDYQGQLVNRLTQGAFPVLRVVGVDADGGRAFVMANAEEQLYDTHLYSVRLDGSGFERLTPDEGEHNVTFSPSMDYFIDNHSSIRRPPRADLRSATGDLVMELEASDISGLEEIGWQPPETFVATAADGETPLYGMIFRPKWFNPEHRYPVINYVYSGSWSSEVPNDFRLTSQIARPAQAMAQMGFITVILDPRGTIERGKAFHDVNYGRVGETEIPDHVAVLEQVMADRHYMDADRVGIWGWSGGGYITLRGMLTAPELFKAGIAIAPGGRLGAAHIVEPNMGLYEENVEAYERGWNEPLAGNLAGDLLLIHGIADINAPFGSSMSMVDALIRADKDFDLLVFPTGDHFLTGHRRPYIHRRFQEFFLEALGDVGELN